MNERIRLLADQAGIYKLNLSDETEYWIVEKFAELIVRECVSISNIERDNSVGCGYITQTIGQRIRQHFGVKA